MLLLLRRHAALLVLITLIGLALGLRVWALDAVPTPSGDEGNWTWYGYELLRGLPASMPRDAQFVSLAFARLIALSYRLFGISFAAARAVLVVGVLCAMVLSYALCAAMGARRAGLVVAAVLALHPWSVLWSRTASVPYALSLAIGTAAPIAWLAALRAPPGWRRTLALLSAGQVLFVGVHFSPLALLPLAACGLWVIARREHRSMLRTPALWAALFLGVLHALPIVRGALGVAAIEGARGPHHRLQAFGSRLNTYMHQAFGGLAGEATLRHFTGRELRLPFEFAAMLAVIVLVTLAALRVLGARGKAAAIESTFVRELRAFALTYLVVALIGLPFVLAPARSWNLPAVDAERYLFALVAPFALLLGALGGEHDAWRAAPAIAFVFYLALGPTARAASYFIRGGGPDRGFYLLNGGGGYRGWKVTRERTSVPLLIRRELDRLARHDEATLVVTDYAFKPVILVDADRRWQTVDYAKAPLPYRRGVRFFFVLWSEGLFARGTDQPAAREVSEDLRRRMHAEYEGVELLRRFVQPNGYPLFEIWTGIQR